MEWHIFNFALLILYIIYITELINRCDRTTKLTSRSKESGNIYTEQLISMGKTIDFLLTARRDTAAALRFFKKAISQHGVPEVVTIDKSGANTAALKVINKDKPEKEAIGILQNKYLNNMIEQGSQKYQAQDTANAWI